MKIQYVTQRKTFQIHNLEGSSSPRYKTYSDLGSCLMCLQLYVTSSQSLQQN